MSNEKTGIGTDSFLFVRWAIKFQPNNFFELMDALSDQSDGIMVRYIYIYICVQRYIVEADPIREA